MTRLTVSLLTLALFADPLAAERQPSGIIRRISVS